VRKFLSDCGITLLLSTPYAPEQKSCRMRTLYGRRAHMVNAVSEQATMPMLAQACETAVYVLKHTEKTSVIR